MNRWVSALLLVLAAVAFVTYPVLRGYGSEAGLQGAALYARPAWLAAHVLGMAGFAVLAIGLKAVDAGAAQWATWGAFLVLPYYGAEAFGLHALGIQARATQQPAMIAAADGFRYESVAMIMFALGWLAWAAVGVRLVVLAVRSAAANRWARGALVLVGVGLITYLPQFFGTPTVRIGHGVVLAAGLLLLAALVTRGADPVVVSGSDYARERAVDLAAR